MNRRNLLLVTLALLLVALGNWLTEQGVKQVDKRRTPVTEVPLDYYINDFVITALDKTGQPQHRLQATRLDHFADSERTGLLQPEIVVFNQQQVEWRVVAERGEIKPQQDEVLLQGKVHLLAPSRDEPIQFTTSALRIQPKRGRADTDQAVTLVQANSRIDAIGMQLDQQKQRLLLLSQVRGRYETLVR